jgi:hypothetical protein
MLNQMVILLISDTSTVLLSLSSLPLAMLSDQLVKNNEPNSQSLLCDAAAGCKLLSISCVCYI